MVQACATLQTRICTGTCLANSQASGSRHRHYTLSRPQFRHWDLGNSEQVSDKSYYGRAEILLLVLVSRRSSSNGRPTDLHSDCCTDRVEHASSDHAEFMYLVLDVAAAMVGVAADLGKSSDIHTCHLPSHSHLETERNMKELNQ